MKKQMTIEDLARLVQSEFGNVQSEFADARKEMHAGFAYIHKDMATKQDLREFREEILSELNKFSGAWTSAYLYL